MSERARLLFIWLLLAAATLVSLSLFEEFKSSAPTRYIGAAVIAIAVLKVRFIGLDFMELRRAPIPLRVAFEVWLLAIGGMLIAIFSGM